MKTIVILTSSVLCLTLLAACEQAEQPAETTAAVESAAPVSTPAEVTEPQQTTVEEAIEQTSQTASDAAGTAQVVTDNALYNIYQLNKKTSYVSHTTNYRPAATPGKQNSCTRSTKR
ncbi:MAG: hypothetical protein KAI17_23620 [Thiotrichaceae bacterium]|nr:hypothetical protein [Thiotrichaceae bacterium]